MIRRTPQIDPTRHKTNAHRIMRHRARGEPITLVIGMQELEEVKTSPGASVTPEDLPSFRRWSALMRWRFKGEIDIHAIYQPDRFRYVLEARATRSS